MNNKVPSAVVLVFADGKVETTDLETLFYLYRPEPVRESLATRGVPLHDQPIHTKDCVKLLAYLMGLRVTRP